MSRPDCRSSCTYLIVSRHQNVSSGSSWRCQSSSLSGGFDRLGAWWSMKMCGRFVELLLTAGRPYMVSEDVHAATIGEGTRCESGADAQR